MGCLGRKSQGLFQRGDTLVGLRLAAKQATFGCQLGCLFEEILDRVGGASGCEWYEEKEEYWEGGVAERVERESLAMGGQTCGFL